MTCEDHTEYDDSDDEYTRDVTVQQKRPRGEDRRNAAFSYFWPHQWLDAEALFAFKYYFIRVSDCFDRKFFKAGRRYTHKCTVFNANPRTKLARHNLVCSTALATHSNCCLGARHLPTSSVFCICVVCPRRLLLARMFPVVLILVLSFLASLQLLVEAVSPAVWRRGICKTTRGQVLLPPAADRVGTAHTQQHV